MPAQPRPAHTVIGGYRARGVDGQIRSAEEFAGLAFTGLTMVDPGVVLVSDWRTDGRARARWPPKSASTAASPSSPESRGRGGVAARYMSTTMSAAGWAQQMSASPGPGGSRGWGE